MPRYRVRNRITKETHEVEAPFAQDACDGLGWMIGNCHIELLREGPYTYLTPIVKVVNTDELLQMPDAEAVALLADEANWPPDVTGAVRDEWRKITAAERLAWLLNVEETRRTIDRDAFLQWQGHGSDRRRGSSIPSWYRQCWRDNARRLRDGI